MQIPLFFMEFFLKRNELRFHHCQKFVLQGVKTGQKYVITEQIWSYPVIPEPSCCTVTYGPLSLY